MRLHSPLVLAAGIVIGLGAAQIQAAATKPTYVCTWIEPKNMDTYVKEYAPKAQALIRKMGGKVNAGVGAEVVSLDSAPAPPRLAIQVWPSMAKLKAYRDSAEFKALNRDQFGTFKGFALEGELK